MAKICISSTRFYDHENSILLEDMELDNRMVRYSYKVRYHNFDEKKLIKHLKVKFNTNDYFLLNAVLEARRIKGLNVHHEAYCIARQELNKQLA